MPLMQFYNKENIYIFLFGSLDSLLQKDSHFLGLDRKCRIMSVWINLSDLEMLTRLEVLLLRSFGRNGLISGPRNWRRGKKIFRLISLDWSFVGKVLHYPL